jgi:class 3 adenylate cyclase
VIELRGDEALGVFSSPASAVRAAIDLVAVSAEEAALDPELPLNVGIGIDVGEAVPVEGGFRGMALNTAARLCSKANGGQVLLTSSVVARTRDLSRNPSTRPARPRCNGYPVRPRAERDHRAVEGFIRRADARRGARARRHARGHRRLRRVRASLGRGHRTS